MGKKAVGYSNESYQATSRRVSRLSSHAEKRARVYAVVSVEDSTVITVGHRFG